MFGISGFELLIIAVFILVIFGPDKLPELARQFGRAMGALKKTQEDMERIVRAEMIAGEKSGSTATPPPIADEAPVSKVAAADSATAVWSATEDDEEEDEE